MSLSLYARSQETIPNLFDRLQAVFSVHATTDIFCSLLYYILDKNNFDQKSKQGYGGDIE